ncbi:unnamed protein product [Spirodela intermedia]|uniref:Uncharacterized protein n=1 Tax=Spirodela intermedia TaxID=51605 RepID=A0A7I8IWH6_SPIIN|nr:unnamed protein product [Spirodela intermedia]CAA6662219.1 unnamed protein product [Spirodela intermedia]
MELDDGWEPTAEELDFLEREAIRKINERKASSAAASTSWPSSPSPAAGVSPSADYGRSPAMVNLGARYEQTSPLKNVGQRPMTTDRIHQRNTNATRMSLLTSLFRGLPCRTCNLMQIFICIRGKNGLSSGLLIEFELCLGLMIGLMLWMLPASSLSVAEEVLSRITCANVEVQKLDPLVHRALLAASAVPDLQGLYDRMPSFIESKLLPFQRDGVRFLLRHGGRVLLADEMGLGKTLQAIAFTACIRESWPVLVLTPSSLRLHWASTIQHWLSIPPSDILACFLNFLLRSYRRIVGTENEVKGGYDVQYTSGKASVRLDGVFNIVSYDTAQKLQDVLLETQFKIVIADESHFLKNAQAKRTSASLPVIQRATYAILLSGTPALSRPIELFKQVIVSRCVQSVHEYGNRYCQGSLFGMYQGACNHEELHNLMKSTVMIRRLKKDVLTELPSKRRQQVFLELDEKDLKRVRALFCELEVIKRNIKESDSPEVTESLKISQRNTINKIYNDSAEAKIPAVIDYLSTVIEADCKFLIFAYHHPMLDAIHKFLLKKKVGCIRIDGSTPSSTRQELVSQFQEKDDIKAAVLSIKAAGFGLTLTAASTVIFSELSWTPGDIIQAEDRAYRIGQVHSVNVYYLLSNETVDDIMW